MLRGEDKFEDKKLDKEKVLEALLRVPLISMQLNHKHIMSSLKDYVLSSEDNLEGQYLKDLFTLYTDAIIEKWYGGIEEATNLLFSSKGK